MLGMNDEQKNLFIRQMVAIVIGPSLTAWGVAATQQAAWVNTVAIVLGGLITLGGMAYSQYKTRNAGLVASANTVPKAAINSDPKIQAAVLESAAKVEDTKIVTKPTLAGLTTPANIVSNVANKVVSQ